MNLIIPIGFLIHLDFILVQLKQLNASDKTKTLSRKSSSTQLGSAAIAANHTTTTNLSAAMPPPPPLQNSSTTPTSTIAINGLGSSGSLKRQGFGKVNNTSVMGKIRDRTGVPV